MRYIAFATDYDGTLATDSRVEEATIRAVESLKATGRKVLLVTGRHLADLQRVSPKLELFDRVVAENGAVLYRPATHEEKSLTEAPREDFVNALRDEGVHFDAGHVVISSWTPAEKPILEVIRRMGLDYQVVFNKGAVMVLPSGVNKATGLRCALEDLRLSPHNTVSIGDGENDHSFLSASECGVAVKNAVPALCDRADFVTEGHHGAGVIELIEQIIKNDLQFYDQRLRRSSIAISVADNGTSDEIRIIPNRNSVLVAGVSASGKSSTVAGILEKAEEQGYQFCLIDPEGDFEHFAGSLSIGSPTEKPDPSVIAKALDSPRSLSVNLMGIPLGERPAAFAALLPKILEVRAKTSRPQWLVIDEAHHLMPASWSPASGMIPQEMGGTILVTVHPEHVSPAALAFVDVVIATGKSAGDTVREFAKTASMDAPAEEAPGPENGEALVWFTRQWKTARRVKVHLGKSERRRHRRNYAQGELSPEQSFYFRGPDLKLNLRAQNLTTFLQLAEGVDDETWLFHLRRGDYSHWFESVIKDDDLAGVAREIERNANGDVAASRARLREAIAARYTAPA